MEEQLWAQFQESGSVADYLRYAEEKGRNRFADSEGRRADAETGR